MNALWTLEEIVMATGGIATLGGKPLGGEELASTEISSVSIDSRTLAPGAIYVAITGVSQDGHNFVGAAMEAGAAAALVRVEYVPADEEGLLIRVTDPLVALEALGRAARARMAGKVIAVTGSAGKTGTKEALRVMLEKSGATHASVKSFNNHWGVPLSLARMPRETKFGIFEVGMNHAGEISPLSKLIEPDVALITTVAPVHIGHFSSEEEIADAKAEIFDGLRDGGAAVLPVDNPHFERLCAAAEAAGIGHIAVNMLGALAAVKLVDGNLPAAVNALADLEPPEGRGVRSELMVNGEPVLLIDESYNANPASMGIAIKGIGNMVGEGYKRRIAVVGDMLELGSGAEDYHRQLSPLISSLDIDFVFAAGEMMKAMYDDLPSEIQGGYAAEARELADVVVAAVKGGDVIMVKGSLGSEMGRVVRALNDSFGAE